MGEVKADREIEGPQSTSKHLKELHTRLMAQEMKALRRAAVQYDRRVTDISSQPGDRVMV